MPVRLRKRKIIAKGNDWIMFKFSPGLWENFLQKCVTNEKGVDGVISRVIYEWHEITNKQVQTEAEIKDQDNLNGV